MPELPEVETIVRDLALNLSGLKIKSSRLLYDKAINLDLKDWRKRLLGQKIIKVWRRGKQIILSLDSGDFLVIHLKMTGQLIWQKNHKLIVGGHPIIGAGQTLPNKFSRVIFSFNDGSQLFFNDVRKFGWLKLLTADELAKKFTNLGIEPLSRGFDGQKLKTVLKNKAKSKIKLALLDQSRVVGIGNIYADEALWLSRLKPDRRVSDLKDREWQSLAVAIKKILRLSIKYRGTSFSDYRDASGAKGNFISHLKVYGRAGQSCYNCQGIIKKFKLGGRGTHWCERCQR